MRKLLFVPVTPEAIEILGQRARAERRRTQDEAAILLERALGLGRGPNAEATVDTDAHPTLTAVPA